MRLFRQSNPIRQALDAHYAASDASERRPDPLPTRHITDVLHVDLQAAHNNLDEIEKRLARIRARQSDIDGSAVMSPRKGSVVQLDLRSIIELDKIDGALDDTDDDHLDHLDHLDDRGDYHADDDFNERFAAFASADIDLDDHSRRWMEG